MPSARGKAAFLLGVLAVGGSLGSCAEPKAEEAPVDRTVWPGGAWKPARQPYDLSHRELAIVDLAWGGDAGADVPPPPPVPIRFVVNLELSTQKDRDGRELGPCLYFRGNRWPLTAESRTLALKNLRMELLLLGLHPAMSTRRFEILVRADYRSLWADVRDVLGVLADPRLNIARVSFAVGCGDPGAYNDGRLDADVVESPSPGAAPTVVAWSLGEGPVGPVLRVGEREMRFSGGDPYAEGPTLVAANESWRAALAALRDARAAGTSSVAIRIEPDVRWAYVAQTLGLLISAGVPEVRIEGDRAYRISTPARAAPWGSDVEAVAHDPPPALVLAIGAALAVALLGLQVVTSRSRRRRRPTP